MNWIDLTVSVFCGIGFVLSIFLGQADLAQTIGVGLLGYLGGKTSSKV